MKLTVVKSIKIIEEEIEIPSHCPHCKKELQYLVQSRLEPMEQMYINFSGEKELVPANVATPEFPEVEEMILGFFCQGCLQDIYTCEVDRTFTL